MKALFVVGPSGSGKTTLSLSLYQIYKQIFDKNTATLISLDPANYLSQNKDIQINQLVTVQDVMQQYEIGPNAAIMYAMDFLFENIQWLLQKIKKRILSITNKSNKQQYVNHLFIFDLPGQIELYLNSSSTLKIIQKITSLICQKSGTSPCMLQLFDCTYMHDINQFISLCMMSLSTMINMQMPHINILNKVDIIKSSQNKPNRGLLDQYFKVHSAAQLVRELKDFGQEQKQDTVDVIARVIDIYGQVSFMPCSIYKMDLICNLVYQLERIFGTLQISMYEPKFMEFVKEIDDFSGQRAITSLQNQFYEQQEKDLQQFQKDLQRQKQTKDN